MEDLAAVDPQFYQSHVRSLVFAGASETWPAAVVETDHVSQVLRILEGQYTQDACSLGVLAYKSGRATCDADVIL